MTLVDREQRRGYVTLVDRVIKHIGLSAEVTGDASNHGCEGNWSGSYYRGSFTDAPESTGNQIRYITKDESRERDPIFPPEPGYDT